ncbi:hypothetical protein [Ferrimicrobium acidiphilum]|uniref:hypothetical protein n=1 Tax=Ferrimicrobium acidiphilum TaxID=121039 RepID=UPI0023F26DE5|nr:hypothetical protein [Ferrimicrobium acidiphilum]
MTMMVTGTITKSGSKEWRLHGRLHRLDGPAVIYADGSERWYRHGKLHRLDGPAVVDSYDDRVVVFAVKDNKLRRLDGLVAVSAKGYQAWYKRGRLHRLDGPAVIYDDVEEWWVDGKRQKTGYKEEE